MVTPARSYDELPCFMTMPSRTARADRFTFPRRVKEASVITRVLPAGTRKASPFRDAENTPFSLTDQEKVRAEFFTPTAFTITSVRSAPKAWPATSARAAAMINILEPMGISLPIRCRNGPQGSRASSARPWARAPSPGGTCARSTPAN